LRERPEMWVTLRATGEIEPIVDRWLQGFVGVSELFLHFVARRKPRKDDQI